MIKSEQNTELMAWNRFLQGDRDALGEIFHQYFSDLLAYGLKITSSSELVKDQIQELFVKLWEKREKLKEVKNVKVYLLISLKNQLLQSLKGNKTNKLDDAELNSYFTISSEDFLIKQEQEKLLAKKVAISLEKLSARQREIIYLRFYMNMDFTQLSEMMEMNVQSVRNLLFRALEKIRNDIDGSDIQQADNIEIILFNLFRK